MSIKVNTYQLQSKSTYAASIASQLREKVDQVNNIYYSLDSKVKSRQGIGSSIRSLQNRIENAQRKMYNISRFLTTAANSYNTAEAVVAARGASIGSMASANAGAIRPGNINVGANTGTVVVGAGFSVIGGAASKKISKAMELKAIKNKVLNNIADSKAAREASRFSKYANLEKKLQRGIKESDELAEKAAMGTRKPDDIDLSKLKPEDVTREIAEWLIANPVNVFATQHPYITQLLTGVDVLGLFYAGGFVMDGDGVYHARQEWSLQSFEYSGYNDFYDTVFHYATSMGKEKFEFNSGGENYILWTWKGDYLNLGAGAEMGIYTRMEVLGAQTEHWLVDQSLAMPMTLTLVYNGKQIISYDPKKVDPQIFDPLRKSTDKWWVTGFNPDYQDVEASELTAIYTATFNTQAMYDDFYNKYGQGRDKDNRWTFDPKTITATFKF